MFRLVAGTNQAVFYIGSIYLDHDAKLKTSCLSVIYNIVLYTV